MGYRIILEKEKSENSDINFLIPITVGYEVKLLDTRSNALISIPGNPEAEVTFGESIDGKWLIVSEGKREIAPGPSINFFTSGWNLYRINKVTGEKFPIVLDKNIIVSVRSPKEDLIAYVTNNFGLWLVNLDGTNKRHIVPDYTVMEFNILSGIKYPMIYWSPDGKKITFSTFPKGYKGEDMWMNSGVGYYLLDKDEFILLTSYDLLKIIGFYSIENKCFKNYTYLKSYLDNPIYSSYCLSDYRCHGWLNNETIIIGILQPNSICGLVEWHGLLTMDLNWKTNLLFDFNNFMGVVV
jgi:hypothetical protein